MMKKIALALLLLLLLKGEANATNRTSWTAGNGQGLSWSARTTAFGTADLTSLASGSSILSSNTIANGSPTLDMFMDISVEITISSATPTAGGYISVYLANTDQNGTIGDGGLVAGTQKAYVPLYAPACIIPLVNAATTIMAGSCTGILVPPGTFSFVVYNFSGQAFSATAANNIVSYRTYNINLNN